MKLFSLDERLSKCASLVPDGARLVDVGTDHAYLPVWLLKNGAISYAVASDINEKPLKSGMETAEKYGAENIDFRLGSGLETISEDDGITCAVIAGMGGEIIAGIIDNSEIAKKIRLVLQPMTRSEELIAYLCKNGFEIARQVCAFSRGKYYTILAARYSGQAETFDESFFYLGKLDLTDEASRVFLQNQIKNLENKAKGDSSLLPLIEKLKDKMK